MALTMLAGVCGGCRSSVYYANAVPDQFLASPSASVESLDLSKLASRTVQHDAIYPGDILEITTTTGLEHQLPRAWHLRVAHDGTVDVPLIGRLNVARLNVFAAENAIRQAAIERGIYRNPAVTVTIFERRANQVTVVGAVEEPGVYELPVYNSDLFAAIVAAGGLAEEADSIVEIRHPPQSNVPGLPAAPAPAIAGVEQARFAGFGAPDHRPAPVRVDLVSATNEASSYGLEDGAVVMVMKQPERHIHVMGLVARPGEYELRRGKDIYVLDAVALAGGTSINVANKVYVIRQVPEQPEPIVIQVSLRGAKHDSRQNLRLAAGDVVSIEETPLTYLVSAINNFVNVGVGLTGGIPIF